MTDFRALTEFWDEPMSSSQLDMAHTRYRLALDHARDKDVVEIGCGSGFGLALLATGARTVVGGDVTEANVRAARERTGLPVMLLDAHTPPLRDGAFDVVLLFENIYYLRSPLVALNEARRVLRPGGTLLVCLPNSDRPGFHPSPHAFTYPGVPALAALLDTAGYSASIFGGFPIGHGGLKEKAFLVAATAARKAHVIPTTLAGRARIKRILFGKLETFKGLDLTHAAAPLTPLDATRPTSAFKVLYAVAVARAT